MMTVLVVPAGFTANGLILGWRQSTPTCVVFALRRVAAAQGIARPPFGHSKLPGLELLDHEYFYRLTRLEPSDAYHQWRWARDVLLDWPSHTNATIDLALFSGYGSKPEELDSRFIHQIFLLGENPVHYHTVDSVLLYLLEKYAFRGAEDSLGNERSVVEWLCTRQKKMHPVSARRLCDWIRLHLSNQAGCDCGNARSNE